MGGFALALGGAGEAAQKYGAQQRQILESRRHDFQGLLGQVLQQPGISPEFKSTVFGLGQDVASGKNLGPIFDKFQKSAQKEKQGNDALHNTLDQVSGGGNAPPPPPPGPTPSGQVAGVGGNAAVTPPVNAALPPSSPIAGGDQIKTPPPVSGTMSPGMVGVSLQNIGAPPLTPPVTAASDVAAPPLPIAATANAALTPSPVTAAPSLSDQYQLNPLEQMQMQQYQRELASPWGPSARTEAAMTPIFTRMAQLSQLRGTAKVDIEKANETFQQNLAHAQQLFGSDYAAKMAPEMLSEFAATGQIKPSSVLKPGEQISSLITGKPLATSTQPRLEQVNEGAQLVAVQPQGDNSGGSAPAYPGVPGATGTLPPPPPSSALPPLPGSASVIASSPPKLTPEESRSQAAALVTAKKYGAPFDPNIDPRNPLKQLPPEHQMEAAQLAKEMNEDPDIRADRLKQYQLMEQMRNMQSMLLQTQLGNIPTDDNYKQMAKAVVDHTLSPDELRTLRSGGMRGWNPTKVFAETKSIDPNFSWEKAENEYKAMSATERNFTSGGAANTVRANNVALEHLGMLDEAREAMNNGNIPLLNVIANNIGVQAGKTGKTTYDTIAQAVGKEVNKAYVPGGGGQRERLAEASDFSSGKGDNQIKQNIKATVSLMSAQQRGLENQYKNGTYGQGTQSLWTPEALAVRERLTGLSAKPQGGPPQSVINGTKEGQYIHSADGSQTWKKVNGKAIPQLSPVH